MTPYNNFKTYSLDQNKISVVKGRGVNCTWFINAGNSRYPVMVHTYEDAVNEINKLVR